MHAEPPNPNRDIPVLWFRFGVDGQEIDRAWVDPVLPNATLNAVRIFVGYLTTIADADRAGRIWRLELSTPGMRLPEIITNAPPPDTEPPAPGRREAPTV